MRPVCVCMAETHMELAATVSEQKEEKGAEEVGLYSGGVSHFVGPA